MLSWNQARVDVVETCSLASAGELSVLFTCGTRARWSSTTRAGLRAQFTALSQHFARVSVETIGYTFYRHYIFCFYNGRKLLVFGPGSVRWGTWTGSGKFLRNPVQTCLNLSGICPSRGELNLSKNRARGSHTHPKP